MKYLILVMLMVGCKPGPKCSVGDTVLIESKTIYDTCHGTVRSLAFVDNQYTYLIVDTVCFAAKPEMTVVIPQLIKYESNVNCTSKIWW